MRDNLAFKNINGQYLGAAPVRDMDSLPELDYTDFFEQIGNLLEPQDIYLPMETSRGCWWGEKHHCTFCGLNGDTMAYRSKSEARALSELQTLAARNPEQSIFVVDNILDMRYFHSFIPALKTNPVKSDLFYEVKANLRKDQIRDMVAAGITGIQPGIESLSDHVLNLMRKGVSALQNIQLLKWSAELGMNVIWNIIWGFPEETVEDYEQVTALIPYLTHLIPPASAARLRLDRFSPNYEEADTFGFENIRATLPYRYIYPFDIQTTTNLAYHFAFDYVDGRDVLRYANPLLKAVAAWRSEHRMSSHFYCAVDDALVIFDLRKIASHTVSILRGAQRTIYEHCDRAQTIQHLRNLSQDADSILAELVAKDILLFQNGRYLSLAVPLGEAYTPSTQAIERLLFKLEYENVIFSDSPQTANDGQTLTADYFAWHSDGRLIVDRAGMQYLLDKNRLRLATQTIYPIAGIKA